MSKGSVTPLHTAASSGNVAQVRRLYREYDVNCVDSKGETPLHYASWNGHLDVVCVLISECKANINVKDAGGHTPLHVAALRSHVIA